MKKISAFLCIFLVAVTLCACSAARRQSLLSPAAVAPSEAVIDIAETERSKIDVPKTEQVTTLPQYFEVVATGTTAKTTKREPAKTEEPKEYFTVKFVDTDGYTAISVQTVLEGGDAKPPIMPQTRGELIFRGWDNNYTNIQRGMVLKAIYQKEWLTVRFFDADATLIKTDTVRYGETAVPPDMKDKGEYLFDGWNILFSDVTKDLDVYATYYIPEKRSYITLTDAYSLLEITENAIGIPENAYYRKNHTSVVEIGKNEYYNNIIYGNFCDTLPIDGYNFKTLEGTLVLKGKANDSANTYKLNLTVYADGEAVYQTSLGTVNGYRKFSVDLEGVKELTVHLEPLVNDSIYYGDVSFIGGLVDTALYKD